MILKHCLVAVASLLCSFCYSETIQGTTPNAAANGLTWNMPNVLPPEAGLTVNGITYRYTANKEVNDAMIVNIMNENAIDGGYLYQKTDNWSGLPGNTITNTLPLNNIPYEYWGRGQITVDGVGTVDDASVVYNYTYDTCYDPMSDPRCPGYQQKFDDFINDYALVYDPLDDENIKASLNNSYIPEDYNDTNDGTKNKDSKEKKDKRINDAKNALLTAEVIANAALLEAMNNVPGFKLYYASIPGGVYDDAINYQSEQIPDSRQGLRVGLAQQLLHNKMVEMQYTR